MHTGCKNHHTDLSPNYRSLAVLALMRAVDLRDTLLEDLESLDDQQVG